MGVGLTCPEKGIVVVFLALALLGLGTGLWSARKRPEIGSALSERQQVAPIESQSKAKSNLQEGLDVNAATESELSSLRGIGPVLAKRIVDYRCENGPFICIEELLNVKGIGPKTLADIERGIFCGPQPENQESGFE